MVAASVTSTSADWSDLAMAGTIDSDCAFPDDLSPSAIQLTDWGFTIPAGSTINGISVTVQGASTAGGNAIQMIQGGTAQGTVIDAPIAGGGCPGTSEVVGSASELWALAWTDANINAADFGVQYDAEFQGRQFDGVEVTVDFTPPPPPEADIQVTSVENSDDPVYAGSGPDHMDYLFTVDNLGPLDATSLELSWTLSGPFSSCTLSPSSGVLGLNTWSIGSLAEADAPVTLGVQCTALASDSAGTVEVTVAVVSLDQPDSNNGNDSATESTTVLTEADLSISKSDDPDPVIAGESLTYTIRVDNAGPSDAGNVVVSDILPVGLSGESTTGCTEDPAGVPTCSLGTIAAGGFAEYTISATTDSGLAHESVIMNGASVQSSTTDPSAENNSIDITTDVLRLSDLEVTSKTDAPDPVIAGTQLQYVITYFNNGSSDADNVTITDALPVGLTYISDMGSCVEAPANTLTCNVGTVAAGAGSMFSVTASVDANLAHNTVLNNTASIASDSADPDDSNDSASEETTVITEAYFDVTKVFPGQPDRDDNVEIILTCNGSEADSDVISLPDDFPTRLTVTGFVNGGTSCTVTEVVPDDSFGFYVGDCEVANVVSNTTYDCTIENVPYSEPIPATNQVALAILSMLVLLTGLIGFRRYS